MRLPALASLTSAAILVAAAACSTFQGEPDPNEGGSDGSDAGGDATSSDVSIPDGTARPIISCSGAIQCEDFDDRGGVSELPGSRGQENATHALVGTVGSPDRHLEVSVDAKKANNTGGQIWNSFTPALDSYELSMDVTIKTLTNIELCALNYELSNGDVYGIFVVVRGNLLTIADYGTKAAGGGTFQSTELSLGPVPEGKTFRLGVTLSRVTNSAIVFVDGFPIGRPYVAAFPAIAKGIVFYYGPFSDRAHTATTISYDNVKLRGN